MKVILRGRAKGKTTDAIKIANETGAYLVVANRRLATHAQYYGASHFPVTFDELLDTKMRGSFNRRIVIDDTDALLRYLLPHLEIVAVTINGEETT